MKHLFAMSMFTLLIPATALAGPCTADKEKFCKDVAKESVSSCLKQHMNELSEACKKARTASDTGESPESEKAPAEK